MISSVSNKMILAGSVLMGLGALKQCIFKVEPGERAIIFDKFGGGIQTGVKGEGFNFYVPFKQEVIKYDIKI